MTTNLQPKQNMINILTQTSFPMCYNGYHYSCGIYTDVLGNLFCHPIAVINFYARYQSHRHRHPYKAIKLKSAINYWHRLKSIPNIESFSIGLAVRIFET